MKMGLLLIAAMVVFMVYIDAKRFAAKQLRDSSLSFREITRQTMELKIQNKLTREVIRTNSSFRPGFFEVFIDLLYRFNERR